LNNKDFDDHKELAGSFHQSIIGINFSKPAEI